MNDMSKQINEQAKVLELMRSYQLLHGKLPSLSYIAEKLGYKHRSLAQYHVKNIKEGKLLEGTGSFTSMLDIPLVGSVSCGPALLAEENIEAYIPVDASTLKKRSGHYFFLRADGDSMNRANVYPGDYVLVRQEQTAAPGEIVVALIGDDATLKKLSKTSDGVPVLEPCSDNPKHKPRIMLEDFSILGIMERAMTPKKENAM